MRNITRGELSENVLDEEGPHRLGHKGIQVWQINEFDPEELYHGNDANNELATETLISLRNKGYFGSHQMRVTIGVA